MHWYFQNYLLRILRYLKLYLKLPFIKELRYGDRNKGRIKELTSFIFRMEEFRCVTCRVKFNEALMHREHFKSDWHLYNLKRKVTINVSIKNIA